VRHGGLTLPSAANPAITAGGLCGESKTEILDTVTGPVRDLLARYTNVTAGPVSTAEGAIGAAALDYPMVAKPDIGCNGTGVRLLRQRDDLARYLAEFPHGERVMLQEFVPDDGEAGIFYIRRPDSPQGQITSITLKHAPSVVGDGRSTLQQLILADPRAGRVPQLYLPRLADRLHAVPKDGERVRLVFVGNHCKGSIFEDGTHLATPALAEAFDRIARAMPTFFFGRIDVRFASLPALLRGEGFRIIEINGAGSEATHIWDADMTLREAWRAQFQHYRAAFEIGAANRARGHRPCDIRALYRLWRRQRRLMASYPMND
jgi:ATP-grasp domain